ncbi:LytR/AlgR family response regulator transcription factor [Taibaiella koreensis]|uniref:LytR/AlgR family response regulator transcription factor n=1 Tax=Taibaiella koreensis TaxID=1268548 RepID=UPI000E59BDC8|nr:LytTR family DNA-binding domain-containing protein [Taibaiella koreensis]
MILPTPLKLLLIDDEKEACDHLRHTIESLHDPAMIIAGTAHNTTQAEELIAAIQPDAILIDIEMPGENAFQFLERMAPLRFKVIFVTAYDAYAVRAFRLNAIDYILKPVSIDELLTALERLKAGSIPGEAGLYHSVSAQLSEKSALKRIRLRSGNHLDIVDIADLYCLEAQRAYCKIYFKANGKDKTIIMSRALTDYAEILPTQSFYRIHKSYLVNCSHIRHIVTSPEPAAVLSNGMHIPVSRRRYASLLSFLSNGHFQAGNALYQ